jgi:hypothetical protein
MIHPAAWRNGRLELLAHKPRSGVCHRERVECVAPPH